MENQRNFEIVLKGCRTHVDLDNKEKMEYLFSIFLADQVYQAIVPFEELTTFSWVEKATMGRARYMLKKGIETDFYTYIHDRLDEGIKNVEKEVVFDSNGWKKIGGRWVYVTGNGCIGSDCKNVCGNPEYRLETDMYLPNFMAVKRFLEMQNVFKDYRLSRWLQLFVCASVCGTLFEKAGAPIHFVTAMVGTTNTKKTSTARVFTQFLNACNGLKVPVTFASTIGGIETFVSEYSDAVLLVDDFMPADSPAEWNEQVSKLKFLIRMYGDGVSKERMKGGFDSRSRRANNLVKGSALITAEMLPGITSSQTRIVRLDIPSEGVDLLWLTFFQNNPLILPSFLKLFLEYIARNPEYFEYFVQSRFPVYRQQAGFRVSRFNDVYAQMLIVLDVLVDMTGEYGYNVEQIHTEWEQSIRSILCENDERIEGENYLNLIAGALHYGIEKMGGAKRLSDIQEWRTNAVYEDEKFFYLTQDLVYVMYCEYTKKMNYANCLSKNELIKKMKEENLLEIEKDYRGYDLASRKLCQKKGIKSRFLYVRKSMIYSMWDAEYFNG